MDFDNEGATLHNIRQWVASFGIHAAWRSTFLKPTLVFYPNSVVLKWRRDITIKRPGATGEETRPVWSSTVIAVPQAYRVVVRFSPVSPSSDTLQFKLLFTGDALPDSLIRLFPEYSWSTAAGGPQPKSPCTLR